MRDTENGMEEREVLLSAISTVSYVSGLGATSARRYIVSPSISRMRWRLSEAADTCTALLKRIVYQTNA
jgi:hypothetical protein